MKRNEELIEKDQNDSNFEVIEEKEKFTLNKSQKLVLIAPILLVAMMYPTFQLFALLVGKNIAWYLGLAVYWLAWGAIFSFWMLGKEDLKKLIEPQKPSLLILLIVIVPLGIVFIWKFVMGGEYAKETPLSLLFLILSAFGNGFFEEVIWRGVYTKYFPKNYYIRVGWSSLWFAIWHFAPNAVSSNNVNVFVFVIGAGFFGIYLSFISLKTDSIWWCIFIHTISGIFMVI